MTRRLFGLAFGLVVALTLGLTDGVGERPARADEPKLGEGKRAQEFIKAFNSGDAKACAGFYTEDGDYTDQEGHHYKGRAALEKLYEKVFAANKGAKLAIHVISARMVTPDVGIEDGVTEVTSPDGGPPSMAAFTAVAVKKDGVWYLESVRDSVYHPPSNSVHFEDLEWLIGEWAGEAEKGQSGTASYEYAENRNFIVSHFATTLNGIPVVGGTQWIGWDAIDKQVRSWSFYSGGGIGEAVWTHEGNKWLLKVTARMSAGKKASATIVVTKVDDDHMIWQITQLTVDGKEIPDPAPQKLKRVREARP
jgi:uncharacterized protein (TIGR02246 family)